MDNQIFAESILIQEVTPLHDTAADFILLSDFVDVNQFDLNKAIIKGLPIFIDKNKIMGLPIPGRSLVNINFKYKTK